MYRRCVSQCNICLRHYIHMPHTNPKCRVDLDATFTRRPFEEVFPNPDVRLSYCIQCRLIVHGPPMTQETCDLCRLRNYKSLTPEDLL